MIINGQRAFFKDPILAVERAVDIKEVTINDKKYLVIGKRQSEFTSVWNYHLQEIHG